MNEATEMRMDAYYYGFNPTGVEAIDRILSAVAWAGKAYHHTDSWTDEVESYSDYLKGNSPVEWIQNAANDAASTLPIAGEGKVAAAEPQPASTALVETGKRWLVFENIFAGEWGIEEDDEDGEVILPPRRIVREHLDEIVSRFNAALSSAHPSSMGSLKAKSPSRDRAASEGVFAQLILIKQLAKDTTERNWADKSLYIAQAAERALAEG